MFQKSIQALFSKTCPLGSKLSLCYFLQSLFTWAGSHQPSLVFGRDDRCLMTNDNLLLNNARGYPHSHGEDWLSLTGVNWAREEPFQSHTFSTHQILRPNLSQQNDSEAKASPPPVTVHAPWSAKGQEQITKDLPDTEERGITTHFRHWWGLKSLCSATFKWGLVKTTDDNRGRQAMVTLSHSFLFFTFFLNFLFNRVLHWSVQKLNKYSKPLTIVFQEARAAPAGERTFVNRGSHG